MLHKKEIITIRSSKRVPYSRPESGLTALVYRMSATSGLPFELLHAEIVRYASDREAERDRAKAAWKRLSDGAVDVDEFEAHAKLMDDAFALVRSPRSFLRCF